MYRRVGEDPDGVLPTETHAPYDVKLGIIAIVWLLLCPICVIHCLFTSRILICMNHYLSVYICMGCLNYGLVPRAGFWMLLMTQTGPIACSFNSSRVVYSWMFVSMTIAVICCKYVHIDFSDFARYAIFIFSRSCSTTIIFMDLFDLFIVSHFLTSSWMPKSAVLCLC